MLGKMLLYLGTVVKSGHREPKLRIVFPILDFSAVLKLGVES